MEIVFHCEIDTHCQRVLKKHWPGVPLHDDITTLEASAIPAAELWCAGWPCQDVSHANAQRLGLDGHRSGLFFSFMELVRKVQPAWLVLENVTGLLSADDGAALERVADELEASGYLGGWMAIDTQHAGLPQHRERLYFVASLGSDRAYQVVVDSGELYRNSPARAQGKAKAGSDLREVAEGYDPVVVQRRGGFGYTKANRICPTIRAQTGKHQGGHSDRPILCGQELDVGRMREADGLSGRMDGRRGRLIGNAVAPPVAEWIGRQIREVQEKEPSAPAMRPKSAAV